MKKLSLLPTIITDNTELSDKSLSRAANVPAITLQGRGEGGRSSNFSPPCQARSPHHRNSWCLITLALCLAALILPPAAHAGKADGKKAKLIAKYDKNGNGIIDGDEKDAMRKDYAANPNGELKEFDTDHDGKLSDEEIAAIKPGSGGKKKQAITDVLAKYDKNGNGVIDGDEIVALRKDFAAAPDGELKAFDKNHDGKLDDEEIAAIKAPPAKKKGSKSATAENPAPDAATKPAN